MSKKGPDTEQEMTTQQFLSNALLNKVVSEWSQLGEGEEKPLLSQEQCALEVLLHCKSRTGDDGKGPKVHNPLQVLDAVLDVVNSSYNNAELSDGERLKNVETAIATLQKVIEYSGLAYQDMNTDGTKLNHKFNHTMEEMAKLMGKEKAKMTQIAIEGICNQQVRKAESAKKDATQLIENEQGIDIADFLASKPRVGNYSKKQITTAAKAIASDLQAFQMSETQLLGSDEHEIGRHNEFFNGISSMLTDGILNAKSEAEAVNTLRLFIEVGKQCVENNDFDSAQAISAALVSNDISRLYHEDEFSGIMKKLPKSSIKDFKDLKALMGPTNDCKERLRVKLDAAANEWHTVPSPTFMQKLAAVDGMDQKFHDKLEVASKSILVLTEQREMQKAHPTQAEPQTNFIHILATRPRLSDGQKNARMNELRTERRYDAKKFKSVTPLEGTEQPDFSAIIQDYSPKIIDDPFIEDDVLDLPADMQEYPEPVVDLELDDQDPDEVIEIGPGVGEKQEIGTEAPRTVVPPLNLAAVRPKGVPPLDLSQIDKADDPSPKMPRGVPPLDLSQVDRADDPSPKMPRGVPPLDLSQVERADDPSPKVQRELPTLEANQLQAPKEDKQQELGTEQKQRRRRKHKTREPEAKEPTQDVVGQATHMTAQFTSMLQRHQQQSEKDWSPAMPTPEKQAPSVSAKKENPRPKTGVGGLTAMFEAKIEKQREEKAREYKKDMPQQETDSSKSRKLK